MYWYQFENAYNHYKTVTKEIFFGVKRWFVVYILNIKVNIDVLKNHLGLIYMYKKLFLPIVYHFFESLTCFKKLFSVEFDIDPNQDS